VPSSGTPGAVCSMKCSSYARCVLTTEERSNSRCNGFCRIQFRQREGDIVKTLAFVIGLGIMLVGAIGIVKPSALVWIARRFGTPEEWYALGAFRVAIGLLLLSVAKASRAPRTLRVLALIPLVLGLAALATPSVGVERARGAIDWWLLLGSGYVRLTAIPILALGGFVAYACAPARRAA
jgi:hypothetical protein